MARTLHRLGCVVCHPITVRRRRRFADDIRDEGHALWADQLAAGARRDRLRRTLIDLDAQPWQIDYLTALVEADLVPLQYPQVTYNFGRLVEQCENAAHKRLPLREIEGYPADHMAQDEALIAEWESRQ